MFTGKLSQVLMENLASTRIAKKTVEQKSEIEEYIQCLISELRITTNRDKIASTFRQ